MKLFAFLSGGTLAAAKIWTDCSAPAAHLKSLNLSFTPDPPTLGSDLRIVMTGTLDEEMTGGSLNVWLKLLDTITVVNRTYNVCQMSQEYQCPYPVGGINVTLPDVPTTGAPSGDYTGQMYMTDQSNQQVACVTLDVHL